MKYYGIKNGKEHGFYLDPFEGAVEVEDEVWANLLDQCSSGKVIKPDENGYPIAVDNVRSDEELITEARVKRDALLAQSDWTQLQDAVLSEEDVQKWRMYRQALRDVPQQSEFPQQIIWPTL